MMSKKYRGPRDRRFLLVGELEVASWVKVRWEDRFGFDRWGRCRGRTRK